MSAIGVIVSIDISEDRVDELLALLERMARSARADAGTDVWDVCRDVDRTGRFYLYERYRDRDALRLHRRNTELSELGVRLSELVDNIVITRLDINGDAAEAASAVQGEGS